MRVLLLVLAVLVSGSALARPPQQFVEPDESARQGADQVRKNRVDFYDDALTRNEKPFPWRAVALMGIVFLVAAPFGIRTWMNLSKELTSNGPDRDLGQG